MRYSLNQGSADSVPVSPLLFPATRCVFATFRSFRPAPLRKSRRFMLLRALELSCRSFCNSDPLFSTACTLFCQNAGGWVCLLHPGATLGLSAGVDEDSPRRRCLYGTPLHTNSFASYHTPATPAVSCSCALFRATARSYPSYFQQLPHSFYRHGGGTPVTSVYPEPSKGAPISAPSVLRFFPFWFACAQAVAGPRMIAYEAC